MTTMATKVKLAVTDPITVVTLTVTEAVEVEGNFGPQARITGTTAEGDVLTLYEKLDAVNRQLGRIGRSMADVVGERLAFWKETASNKAGQTFPALRIETADGSSTPKAPAPAARPAAAPARAPMALGASLPWEEQETGAPPAASIAPPKIGREAEVANRDARLAAQFALYTKCLDKALSEVIRTGLDKLGGDVAGAVVAAAATLFIQANKQ